MKKLLSASIIILIFAAFTSIAPGITGTWTATISGPNGEAEITYNFEAEEDTLTGTVVGGMGEVEILNGKVDEKEFYFETQFNNVTISHECVLKDENTIAMKYTFEGEPGPQEPQNLTLTRVAGDG